MNETPQNPVQPPTPPVYQANPQPPRSSKEVVRFTAIVLISCAVGIGLIIWGIVALLSLNGAKERNIIKNGIPTPGLSTGRYIEGPEKNGRRSVTKAINAYYEYTVDGDVHRVAGEKNYKNPDNIREGMKATVYYMANDPEEAVVTNEE